jgi:hypothetical protein
MQNEQVELSIAPSSTTATMDKPFTITVDSTPSPRGEYRFETVSPGGTVNRGAGFLEGADADQLGLYSLACALVSIPKGTTLHVRTTSSTIASVGKRLTKPAPIPELSFLPFTADRRAAWEFMLPTLSAYTITWQVVRSVDAMLLAQWAATQRQQ